MPFARLFTHLELDEWNKLQFLFVSEIQNRLNRNNGRDAHVGFNEKGFLV